jgi:hypothetical protein
MQLFRVLALTIAALVVSTPGVSHAGGRLGMGRGHSQHGSKIDVQSFSAAR